MLSKPSTLGRPRPNILWIVTTQWRASACGYAGDVNARTPCVDRLAAESVNYTQAVTPHPFGPFARAALLTGVPSPENGVRDYFDPLPFYDGDAGSGGQRPPLQPIPGRTIAHALNERGYATAYFGKWHLAKRDPRAPLVGEAHARTIVAPEARGGFSFWEGFEGGFLLNDPWLHGTRLAEPAKFAGYQSDVLCGRAAEWISAEAESGAGGRPWFAVVSLEAPHPPYAAPAAGVGVRDPREIVLAPNVPRGGAVEAKARSELAGYYAHLEATDRAIGRLVEALERENTVVVFTAVHGDLHGAHGLFRKGWPYEEAVRVPLLVRGAHERGPEFRLPGFGSGVRSSALVSLVDLPRMTLAWAEGLAEPLRRQEGRTSIAELRSPNFEGQRLAMPSVVELPLQCDRVWRGGRTATRKLVLNADGSPWLFFDLARDPYELENLVADPERAGEMAALRPFV